MTTRSVLKAKGCGWVYRGLTAEWDESRDQAFVAAILEANKLSPRALAQHVNWPFHFNKLGAKL
eukprot:SAG31_NODE_1989_length_6721_cov_5.737391_5_plen_64_part_00